MTSKTTEKLIRHFKKKFSKKISGGDENNTTPLPNAPPLSDLNKPNELPQQPLQLPPPQQLLQPQQQSTSIMPPPPPQQQQLQPPQQQSISIMPPPPPQQQQPPQQYQQPPQQYQQPPQQQYQQQPQQQYFQQQPIMKIPTQETSSGLSISPLENKNEVFMGLDDNEILILVVFISIIVVVYSAAIYLFDNIPVLFDNMLHTALFCSVIGCVIYILVLQNSYLKLGLFYKLNWILMILFITAPIAFNILTDNLDSMFPDLFSFPDFLIEFKDILYNLLIIVYIVAAIILTFVLPKLLCKNPKSGAFCILYKLYDVFGLEELTT